MIMLNKNFSLSLPMSYHNPTLHQYLKISIIVRYTISDLTIQKKLSVKDTKKITGNKKKVINLRRRCEDKASTHYLI